MINSPTSTDSPTGSVTAENQRADHPERTYVEACLDSLNMPDWQPNRTVWKDLCDTAMRLIDEALRSTTPVSVRPDLADDLRYIAAHENDPREEEIIYEAAEALDALAASPEHSPDRAVSEVSEAMIEKLFAAFERAFIFICHNHPLGLTNDRTEAGKLIDDLRVPLAEGRDALEETARSKP